jgi:hypothetical protein
MRRCNGSGGLERPLRSRTLLAVPRAYGIGFLLVAVAATWPAVVHADTEAQRHTLAGLRSLHVQLELRGDDLEKFEVTDAVLRPEVESRLYAAGITLLDVEASSRTPGVPWLFVFVTIVRSQDAKEYAWTIHLQLQQRTCLERDPTICESASTWETIRLGSVGRRRVKTLREDVIDLTSQFTNAWVSVNPSR